MHSQASLTVLSTQYRNQNTESYSWLKLWIEISQTLGNNYNLPDNVQLYQYRILNMPCTWMHLQAPLTVSVIKNSWCYQYRIHKHVVVTITINLTQQANRASAYLLECALSPSCQFFGCQLLTAHPHQLTWAYLLSQHFPEQTLVFRVLEIEDEATILILVFGVDVLVEVE